MSKIFNCHSFFVVALLLQLLYKHANTLGETNPRGGHPLLIRLGAIRGSASPSSINRRNTHNTRKSTPTHTPSHFSFHHSAQHSTRAWTQKKKMLFTFWTLRQSRKMPPHWSKMPSLGSFTTLRVWHSFTSFQAIGDQDHLTAHQSTWRSGAIWARRKERG